MEQATAVLEASGQPVALAGFLSRPPRPSALMHAYVTLSLLAGVRTEEAREPRLDHVNLAGCPRPARQCHLISASGDRCVRTATPRPSVADVEPVVRAAPEQPQRQLHHPRRRAAEVAQVSHHGRPASRPGAVTSPHRHGSLPQGLETSCTGSGNEDPFDRWRRKQGCASPRADATGLGRRRGSCAEPAQPNTAGRSGERSCADPQPQAVVEVTGLRPPGLSAPQPGDLLQPGKDLGALARSEVRPPSSASRSSGSKLD